MSLTLCTETSLAMERPRRGRQNNNRNRNTSRNRRAPAKKGGKKGGKSAPEQTEGGRLLSKNKWFNLVMAAISELAGGVDIQDKIVDCLPEQWRPKVKDNETNKSDDKSATSAGQSSKTLKKVLDIVSKVINIVCKYKDKIIGLLKKKLRRQYRRQQMRMNFVESETASKASMKSFKYYRRWIGKKLKDKFKRGVKNLGNKIKSGARKIGNAAKKGFNKLKNLFLTVVKELKDIFGAFVAKIKQIINNPIVQRIVKILKCGKELFGHAKNIISIIKGIVKRVQKVQRAIATQTYVEIVPVMVDLICNFDHFRAAIGHLVSAVKEKNTLQKYIKFGKFFGKLLYALGYGGDKGGKKKGGNKKKTAPKRRNNSRRRNNNRRRGRGRRNYY